MFKSKKKRLLQKAKTDAMAAAMAKTTDTPIISHTEHSIHATAINHSNSNNTPNSVLKTAPLTKKKDEQQQLNYSLLLDDIPLHDFRSSVILPQLNDQLNTTASCTSPPLSPPPSTKSPEYQHSRSSDSSYESVDGNKHYQELMAWRHQRNRNRYSNGLFGGKQRNRPKPRPLRTTTVSVKRAVSHRRRSHHSIESQQHSPVSSDSDAEDEQEGVKKQREMSPLRTLLKEHVYDKDEDGEEKHEEENAQALSDTSIITPPASTTTEVQDTITKKWDFYNSEEEAFFDDDLPAAAVVEEETEPKDYELDSDMEENYFFQDFSTDKDRVSRKAKRQSRAVSRRGTKVMSRFDLSSFAKDLHDNRLSVIQQRHTMMRETTEEDELELEKLMQMQKDRLSYMNVKTKNSSESLAREISELPPVPTFNKEQYYALQQQQQHTENDGSDHMDEVQKASIENEQSQSDNTSKQPTDVVHPEEHATDEDEGNENEEEEEEEEEEEAYPVNGASDSNKIALDEDIEIPPTFKTKPLPQFSLTALPGISTVDSGRINKSNPAPDVPSPTATSPLLPLARSESSNKKALKAPKKPFKKTDIRLVGLVEEENEHIKNATPLASLHIDTSAKRHDDNDRKKNKKSKKTTKKEAKKTVNTTGPRVTSNTSTAMSPTSGGIMSRGLFGSLRQGNRNNSKSTPIISSPMAITSQQQQQQQKMLQTTTPNSTGTLKGLARNLSTNSASTNTSSTHSNRSSSSDHLQQHTVKLSSNNGISRAAMAVIQHNVSHKERKEDDEATTDGVKKDEDKTNGNFKGLVNRQRAKSDTSGPPRLISQLIARASSNRKAAPTKVVNMNKEDANEGQAAAREGRAQVVRKTIIYVQPNSLHNLLKNGGEGSTIKLPTSSSSSVSSKQQSMTSPLSLSQRDTVVSSGSSVISAEGQQQQHHLQQQYLTATKVSRQASVRKRVVDTRKDMDEMSIKSSLTNNLSSPQDEEHNYPRFQVKSIASDDDIAAVEELRNSVSNDETNQQYMEGVEFREMSDGSVVWGLVKKQGNRKSFYAPKQQNSEQPLEFEHIEDEDLPEDTTAVTTTANTIKNHTQHDIPSYDSSLYHDNQSNTNTNIHSFSPPTSLSPPPPIPKRSPRRPPVQPRRGLQTAATDVYYSDQVTLPTLLSKMMPVTTSTTSSIYTTSSNDNHTPYDEDDMSYYGSRYTNGDDEDDCLAQTKNKSFFMNNTAALSSVDDQLDEMMRILTSQQQNEHAAV